MDESYVRSRIGQHVKPTVPNTGQHLYHFSNTQHPVGFLGHQDMWLTEGFTFEDQASEVNIEKPVYRHECEVLIPILLEDMSFTNMVEILVHQKQEDFEEFLASGIEHYKSEAKWYRARAPGAVRVIDNNIYKAN